MHPEIAKTLVVQRHDELMQRAESRRRAPRRRFPRWHISWTRTILAPAGPPGPLGPPGPAVPAGPAGPAGRNRAGHAGRRGSSLVIIISAYRSA
jgi:hypothetical protein